MIHADHLNSALTLPYPRTRSHFPTKHDPATMIHSRSPNSTGIISSLGIPQHPRIISSRRRTTYVIYTNSMPSPLPLNIAKSLTRTYKYPVQNCSGRNIPFNARLRSLSTLPILPLPRSTSSLQPDSIEGIQRDCRGYPRIMVDRQGNVSPTPKYPKPVKELAYASPSSR